MNTNATENKCAGVPVGRRIITSGIIIAAAISNPIHTDNTISVGFDIEQ